MAWVQGSYRSIGLEVTEPTLPLTCRCSSLTRSFRVTLIHILITPPEDVLGVWTEDLQGLAKSKY
jgi:hypothetical protein